MNTYANIVRRRWASIVKFVAWQGIGVGMGLCLTFASAPSETMEGLKTALTHHASFDQGLTAEFSQGDPVMHQFVDGADRKRGGTKAMIGEAARIASESGRFGGALHRERTHPQKLFYDTEGILDYDPESWSGTISLWLRLSPDEDLEPGYCDPVMLIGNDSRKGFIFVEWSADPNPRKFRYAIRPINEIWNPNGLGWEAIPASARPMVQVDKAPFSRDRWTHVVVTFDRVNAGKASSGRLYLDGSLQGAIENWDLTFGWSDANVLLVLGTNYIGFMDDLAVFNRALNDAEIQALFALPNGVGELH